MPPKRKYSYVWKVFERCNNKNFAICTICKKEYTTSGNTSNLLDHLKRKHPEEVTDCEFESDREDNGGQKKMKQTFFSKKCLLLSDNEKSKNDNINRKIAMMIALDLQPYSFVEDKGFLELMETIVPNYKVPCRKTFSEKIIPGIYREISEKLRKILVNIEWISITTDIWTSINSESFCTVTAHFIWESKTRSVVLRTIDLPNSHTAECIKTFIQEVLYSWGIDLRRVVCITTDNGANVKAACSLLQVSHLPCIAHTLNLCIQDVIKQNNRFSLIIQKCRNIVTYFKRSNLAMDNLKIEQDKMNKPKLKLVKDVETRWNSILKMLQRIIEIGDPLTIAQSKSKNAPVILTAEETNIIKELIQILGPLDEATVKLSGEQYPTVSLIIPIVVGLYVKVEKQYVSTNIANEVKHSLLTSIKARLFPYEQRHNLQIATLLDPRMKKVAFRSLENCENAKKLLQEEVSYLLKKQHPASASTTTYSESASMNLDCKDG